MKLTDANRPLRVLDKVLGGGLGKGNIGLVIARHGVGKHAVLTSIAIDHAMDGRNTLHVAIGESVADARAYQDEVLNSIVSILELPNPSEIQSLVERHKQIYTFADGKFDIKRLRETLTFLRDGAEFKPELVEFQQWPNFEEASAETLTELKALAQEFDLEIWLSAHTHREDKTNDAGIPEFVSKVTDQLDVLVALEEKSEHVALHVLKAHDKEVADNINLEFDPKTMMIRWR